MGEFAERRICRSAMSHHTASTSGLIQQGHSQMGRIVSFFLTCGLAVGLAGAVSSAAATTTTTTTQAPHRKSPRLHSTRHVTHAAATTRLVRGKDGKMHRVAVRHRYYERFTGDSYAETDITAGDNTAGEDPVVRAAAIAALGNMNGTAVAIDPS